MDLKSKKTTTAVGEDSIRETLQMVCMIPTDVPLDEYIRQMRIIVAQLPDTMTLMAGIAGRTGWTYDDSRRDYRVDHRLMSRFYRAFAEEQGQVICTTGDNYSCIFHAFSLVIYGHERNDEQFHWLCCVQFMLQNEYYEYYDAHNSRHLQYKSVQLLIHDTALTVQQQQQQPDAQRISGGPAHLKAMSDIARRDFYAYVAHVSAVPPDEDCLSMEDLQRMVDSGEMRCAWHSRYEPFDPIPAGPRTQAIAFLLSDAGSGCAHYSAIFPLHSGIRMLRPIVVLPPPRDGVADPPADRITISNDDCQRASANIQSGRGARKALAAWTRWARQRS